MTRPERGGDPVRGVAVAWRVVGEGLAESWAPQTEEDLGEQVVLGGEPAVDRGERDPGAVGHLLHDHGVVAAGLGELGGGGHDEIPPARLLVREDGGDQKGPAARHENVF